MNAYQLPYLSLFRVCIFFLIFLLIINRESHGVVLVSTNEKRLQNQVYRQIKSKLMDTFGSGKSSLFERFDLSLYHFLSSFSKSKQHSDSPPNFGRHWSWVWFDTNYVRLVFLPARFTRMGASLRNQNRCKPSICYITKSRLDVQLVRKIPLEMFNK